MCYDYSQLFILMVRPMVKPNRNQIIQAICVKLFEFNQYILTPALRYNCNSFEQKPVLKLSFG